MKKIFLGVLLALSVSTVLAATDVASTAHVVKGNIPPVDYKAQPTLLQSAQGFTNPAVYNENNNWRESVVSGNQGQMVLMTIDPKTNPTNDVSNEIHDFDQFILVNSGSALVSFAGGPLTKVSKGGWIFVPAFTAHYIKNASKTQSLKLLSIYTKWDTKEPAIAFKTFADEEAHG